MTANSPFSITTRYLNGNLFHRFYPKDGRAVLHQDKGRGYPPSPRLVGLLPEDQDASQAEMRLACRPIRTTFSHLRDSHDTQGTLRLSSTPMPRREETLWKAPASRSRLTPWSHRKWLKPDCPKRRRQLRHAGRNSPGTFRADLRGDYSPSRQTDRYRPKTCFHRAITARWRRTGR